MSGFCGNVWWFVDGLDYSLIEIYFVSQEKVLSYVTFNYRTGEEELEKGGITKYGFFFEVLSERKDLVMFILNNIF